MIKNALISVSDKTGIVEFARLLRNLGVNLLSTGGTAKLLADAGIPVTEVATHTGFPEIMGGRVKTLHPKIHGGILGRRGEDDAVMVAQGLTPIDMVVVNLYPFAATIARPDCSLAEAIENIDIGGPAMIRSAAKNHVAVTVVVEPSDYAMIGEELQAGQGQLSPERRFALAAKAFRHTAGYDAAVAAYLEQQQSAAVNDLAPVHHVCYTKQQDLRYGENPHQRAAFYREATPASGSIGASVQVQGKALSFNNIADADTALQCVNTYTEPACVIVKHANPCGVAVGATLLASYEHAYATDPTSAFGGIIAFNRVLDGHCAKAILQRQFVELIIARGIEPEAQTVLAAKSDIRVLTVSEPLNNDERWLDYKRVQGGLLVQDNDFGRIARADLKVVSQRPPTEAEFADLLFAWQVVKFVKSNAIVYARERQTIGIGAGQMSRVYSARIAAIKAADAGLETRGAVMASDAFFPFRDGIDSAAQIGITAVIHPGGSIRDAEVIAAADQHGMALVTTGMRHFRH